MKNIASAALLLATLPFCGVASLQSTVDNPDLPKPGAAAPALTFSNLLQAPAGTKVDWPSLKGKVVVLEFWATWCAPCIAEIPVVNSLVAAVDPAKVQFISVDDEAPTVVQPFLAKRPISGWIGLDTSGELFKRYGANARPATIVIDTNGIVVSNNIPPQQLKSEQLLALADGKPVKLGGAVDPAVQAALEAAQAKAFAEQAAPHGESTLKPLFQITLTKAEPAKDGEKTMTHIIKGKGTLDITNAPISTLLENGAGITRLTGDLPNDNYNLHVEAPNSDERVLGKAIELAIASGTGLHIERQTKTTDALVLTATPATKSHLSDHGRSIGAFLDPQHNLKCYGATTSQIAEALEDVLGIPVVDETGLSGQITTSFKLDSKDLATVNPILEKELGVTLSAAKRPIESVVVSK